MVRSYTWHKVLLYEINADSLHATAGIYLFIVNGRIAEVVVVVISDSKCQRDIHAKESPYGRAETQDSSRERAREKQVYQLRKNDGYEAVMCQVDRFFLLLTSFVRHILGDDDNAFVYCIGTPTFRLKLILALI